MSWNVRERKTKADLLWPIKSHADTQIILSARFFFFPGNFRRSVERIKTSAH